MKRTITHLLQAAAVLALTAACQADLPPEQDGSLVPDPNAPIELSGNAPIETTANAAVTRTDNSQLPFKLYAVPDGSATWPATPYINAGAANLASGSGNSRSISTTSTYYWPVGNRTLRFIGVMKADGTNIALSNGTVALAAGEGNGKDILLSNNATGNKSASSVSMPFNRLMARLIVKPGSANKQVVTCNIAGGSTGASYNVLSSGISGKSGTYTINYSTNDGEKVYYLIPGTSISQLTSVVAGSTSKGTVNLTDASGTATSFTTAAGDSYTIEVTAEFATLTIKTASGSIGWESGGDITLS
ncbi:fimbrillin family protein [Bacteroides timonensis]|uniref:fimbrillin family protein n=1 Tax=Bacteroides timonensis TaxID=1470345 RepID=UPI0005C6B9EC|nr:fimbrillin family protein [Bacteroides timonensis]